MKKQQAINKQQKTNNNQQTATITTKSNLSKSYEQDNKIHTVSNNDITTRENVKHNFNNNKT